MTPLLGIGVCVSIQFGILEYTKRYFAAQNLADGEGGEGGRLLGVGQLATAGVLAGLGNGVVSGPVEHIRIREFYIPSRPPHVFNALLFCQACRPNRTQNQFTSALSMPFAKYMRPMGSQGFTKGRQ